MRDDDLPTLPLTLAIMLGATVIAAVPVWLAVNVIANKLPALQAMQAAIGVR